VAHGGTIPISRRFWEHRLVDGPTQLREPWENIGQYSWGSATLAWLYWQLCEGCRRVNPNSNIGGCMYLLQIWIWERIPIGRVHRGIVVVSTFHLIAICVSFHACTMPNAYNCFFFRLGHMVTVVPPSATFGGELSRFGVSRNGATFNTPMIWMF
jgi:hypothetical protein